MTGGLSPAEYGQLEQQGLYAGFILMVGILAATMIAAAIADSIRRRQQRRRHETTIAAERAAQLDAGTRAGWHDASPADRRRDR
jgi:hypothetical protein